ncbi:MAG: DUF4003 domain-containing protein [Lachnospiraceae bacterium]|nr:DUF4003 domain-containing protein [Lachnospiraceae bacterium]
MNEQIKLKCDHFVDNKNKIQNVFKLSNNMLMIATSLVFGDNDVDEEKLSACTKYIEKNTNVLSTFQSKSKPIVASKMTLQNDPEKYFDDVLDVYKILTKKSPTDTGALVQAAMIIVESGKKAEAEKIYEKFRDLYSKMNKKHPLITSTDDITFGYLLCLTDKSVDKIIEEMECAYEYLNKEVKLKVGKNEIQAISEVLTLTDGDMKEKCDKVVAIYNAFSDKDVQFANTHTASSMLGILIDLDMENGALVDEIIEVEKYIKESKGFGKLSLSRKQRLIFATSLVAEYYCTGSNTATIGAVSSVVSTVVVQEIALMMCIFVALY